MVSSLNSSAAVRHLDLGRLLLALLVFATLSLGLFARLHSLSEPTLAVDEFYSVRGVEYILERGVPEFPGGGYYVRGPLYQYIVAVSAAMGEASGFDYRLPSVGFGLLAIVLAYLYSRRFASVPVALAVALALLVSSWHIEFSRFIRMYTMFQAATLLFLIALDAAYFRGRSDLSYLPHLTVVLAGLSHEMGILFAPLLFLPLVPGLTAIAFTGWLQRLRFAALSVLALAICHVASRFNFRALNVADQLPADYEWVTLLSSSFFVPAFPFWQLVDDPVLNFQLLLGLMAAGVAGLLALRRWTNALSAVDLHLLGMIASALVHWFALTLLLFAVLVSRYQVHQRAAQPARTYVMLAATLVIALIWLAYALAVPGRLLVPEVLERWGLEGSEASGLGALARALWTTFFGWPELYHHIIRPFALELPLLGLLTLAALIWAAAAHGRSPWRQLVAHPAFIIVYTMAFFAVFRHHSTTRYWFHLYPVLLCLIGLMLSDLVQRARARQWGGALLQRAPETAAAGLLLGLFMLSSDFNPRHLLAVGDESVAFRTDEFARFAPTWYPREDYQSPAQYVNDHADHAGGERIIVENAPPTTYYLAHDHAVFYHRDNPRGRYSAVSREGGAVDAWSGVALLGTTAEVRDYAAGAGTVWLIREVVPGRYRLDPGAAFGERIADQQVMFTSRDGVLEVVRLALHPGAG
jgi:hypothetical protein